MTLQSKPIEGESLPHKISMQMEVQDVIRFMQDNVCPYRIVSVARSVGMLAPILWGHHRQDEIVPLKVTVDVDALLREDSMLESSQANATQSAGHTDLGLDGGDGLGPEGVRVP